MKIIKPTVWAALRFIGFVVVPLYLVGIVNSKFPGILPYTYEYFRNVVVIVGIPLILLSFFAESVENLKLRIIFEVLSLALVILWTYYILGGGLLHISYEGISLFINYYSLLILILLGIALKLPANIMRYYLESHR